MAGKIAGMFFEIDYKVNSNGLLKANEGLKKTGESAKKASEDMKFVEKGMGNLIGKAAGIVSIGYAFKKTSDLIGQSVVAYTEFDDSLRKTGSKLNLTDAEMKSLANSTRSVALEFNSTGKAVSDAQEFLALAGYNLKEIQAASSTVVAAQRATGESMQLVSDIATDTASSYGYMADELDFVTDRMVYTTTAFNTNFAQMGDAMKYVAPVAKNAGIEFADLNSYIGVLANNGIKASQAGTTLRTMFLRLQAPSVRAQKQLRKFNIELYDRKTGKFIGMNNAMALVEKKMEKMTEKQKAFFMQQVFGTEAMSGANILFKEGTRNIIAYGDAIDEANGKTSQMAKYMEAGIGGMIRSLDSEKDAIKTTLGEAFEPVAWEFVKILRDGTKDIRESLEKEETKSNITKFGLGAWDFVKSGFGLAGDFMYNTGEILNLATGGIFKAVPNAAVGGAVGGVIERGEGVLANQNVERRWMREDKSFLDKNIGELDKYIVENFGLFGAPLKENETYLKIGNQEAKIDKELLSQLSEMQKATYLNNSTSTGGITTFRDVSRGYPTITLNINGITNLNQDAVENLKENISEIMRKEFEKQWAMEKLLLGGEY